MEADLNVEGTPKTPPILYFLAALVVAGIWFAWSGSRKDQIDDLARWDRDILEFEVVAAILEEEGPEPDRLGHALVQLARLAAGDEAKVHPFGTLAPHLARHADVDDPRLRSLVAVASSYIPGEASHDVLRAILEDEDSKVALNAAIGLAARSDPAGADRISEALKATRMDQLEARRNLLFSFRHVASERHVEQLRHELRRAEMDRDETAAAFCREALERLR